MNIQRFAFCLLACITLTNVASAQAPRFEFREFPPDGPEGPPAVAPAPNLTADPLPQDAQSIVENFKKETDAIRKQAQQQIIAKKKKLIEQLKKLQDDYTKPGQLDQALAIREEIRRIKADISEHAAEARPDPRNLMAYREAVGRSFFFRVTGGNTGFIFGTDVYTDDSELATAAVHAGVLRAGQQGIVKVTILPGQAQYAATTRNGVTSNAWSNYPTSYQVQPAD